MAGDCAMLSLFRELYRTRSGICRPVEPVARLQDFVADHRHHSRRNWPVTLSPMTDQWKRARNRIAQTCAHPLTRNTLWSLGGYVFQLALQAGYFILLARALGAAQYGAFISAA